MTLTPEDVKQAYRWLLDRQPSEADCAAMIAQNDSAQTLRRAMLGSPEFQKKYAAVQARIQSVAEPVTLFLRIPGSSDAALVDLLAGQLAMRPWMSLPDGDPAQLQALPLSRQRAMRFVEGPMMHGAGTVLDRPVRYVSLLRQPEARLHALWHAQAEAGALPETGMLLGDLLEFSVDDPAWRQALDNVQMRRFAGHADIAGPDEDRSLLRRALSAALGPDTLCGTAERLEDFARLLVAYGLIDEETDLSGLRPPEAPPPEQITGPLTARQAEILAAYCVCDRYLYDICASLADSPT